MLKKKLSGVILLSCIGGLLADAANYHIDATHGNDARDGASPKSAWMSLGKIDGIELKPGDNILLKAGQVFTGKLHLNGSGADGKPITIDKYGQGANPVINGAVLHANLGQKES